MDKRRSAGKTGVRGFAVFIAVLLTLAAMSVYGCITGSGVVFGADSTGSDNAGMTDSSGASYGNSQGLNDIMSNLSANSQSASQASGIPDITPAATDINAANSGAVSTPDIVSDSSAPGNSSASSSTSGGSSASASSSQTQEQQNVQTASSAPRTGVQQTDPFVLLVVIALSAVGIAVVLLIGYRRRWK